MKVFSIFFLISFDSHVLVLAQLDVQTLINKAISTNAKELVLPAGTYSLSSSLSIYNANGLTIRGSGTKLVFDPTKTKYFDIQIQKSYAVTLKDLEIDNDPLPFTQGKVTSVNTAGSYFDVAIHAGYSTDPTRFGDLCYVHIHDSTTRGFKQEGEMLYTSYAETISGGLRFHLKYNTFK